MCGVFQVLLLGDRQFDNFQPSKPYYYVGDEMGDTLRSGCLFHRPIKSQRSQDSLWQVRIFTLKLLTRVLNTMRCIVEPLPWVGDGAHFACKLSFCWVPIVSGSIKQIRPPYRINSEKRRTDRTKAMELAGYVVRWLCSWLTRAIHVADWLPATCGWPGCLAAYDAIMWLAACLASCLGG